MSKSRTAWQSANAASFLISGQSKEGWADDTLLARRHTQSGLQCRRRNWARRRFPEIPTDERASVACDVEREPAGGGFSIVPGLRSDVTLILASRFPRLLRHLINVIARDAWAATRRDGATIAAE